MPHLPAVPPLLRRAAARGRAALLAVAVGTVAVLAGVELAGTGAAGGAPAWLPPRVAEAAGGSVGASLARRLGGGAAGSRRSGTFARGPGRSTRDVGVGTGRVELRRADGRLAALSVRQQLEDAAEGTYIGELLRQRDSALTRWPDRPNRPLAVFVSDAVPLAGWRPEYVSQVASAFAAWAEAGVPLRFHFVRDSARADVHVGWTDRFREPISGRTVWARDDRWWIVDAHITLALHHSDGAPLDADQVRAIALHEVGHLLGLDHTADPDNVMAPRVRVRDLSSADQATARLLYSVPAGRVR